jgi:uncharacterized protein YcbX
MPDDSHRQVRLDFAQPGDIVSFADAFPILMASEESLADLNSRLAEPLPMNRFRANIIIQGVEAFGEDLWPTVSIGDLRLRAAKKCGRCSVTATNQDTGVVGTEPLRTLATYRQDGNAVMFGAYFIPEATGRIAVGDSLSF